MEIKNENSNKETSNVQSVQKKPVNKIDKKKTNGKSLKGKKSGPNKAKTPPAKKTLPLKIDINKTSTGQSSTAITADSQKTLDIVTKKDKDGSTVKSVKNKVKKSSNEKNTNKPKVLNSEKSIKSDGTVKKKEKKTLTYRQLHKRKKLMEKRKAMRTMKKTSKVKGKHGKVTSENKSDDKTVNNKDASGVDVKEKIVLPKTVAEATSNWRRLQMTMKSDKVGLKRKKDPLKLRNPKYRKLDEKSINERMIHEVTRKDDKSPEIWFDDVEEEYVESMQNESKEKPADESMEKDATAENTDKELVKPEAFKGVTSIVGIDCEMVGVRDNQSTLARVSIVNRYGEPIYDKFVKPNEKVTDYRTHVSGIRPEDLKKGKQFSKVRKEVADILKGRILIGHALTNDFKALKLRHPVADIRDTSSYPPFRALFHSKTPSLRKLTAKVLSVKIQGGEHNSIQDAQAAVRLYTMHRIQWESEYKKKGKNKKKVKGLKTMNEKDTGEKFEVVDRLWNV